MNRDGVVTIQMWLRHMMISRSINIGDIMIMLVRGYV